MKSDSDIWNYFLNLIQRCGKLSDCMHCGQCEERCPQKLPIRDHLDKVTEEVEKKFT